jgi:CIC family chloride channel protein
MDGRLALRLLLILVFAKALAFALTVSSGGSGGVFAPTLFVGAMLGGAVARATDHSTAAFVVVGMAAVFGGAARVPMATLLMVTEMTGGYRLLVPAALAVFLSYLVQRLLSERLRYPSLYEAQVPARLDSPSHHLEHFRNAIHLVQERMVSSSRPLGRLELTALLETGVAVGLGEGQDLALAALRPDSPWIGKPPPRQRLLESGGAQIVAIVRDKQVLVPDTDTVLEGDDLLMLVLGREGWRAVQEHLEAWHPGERS